MLIRVLALSFCFSQVIFAAAPTAYKVAPDSQLTWVGRKAFVKGEHNGTIAVSGHVDVDGTKPKSANLVIHMDTIKNLDQKDPKYAEKLVGHLKSKDFFHVDQFKEARLVLDTFAADGKSATGKLTIRDKTNPVTVKFDQLSVKDGKAVAAGAVTFNRKDYDVKYHDNDAFLAKVEGLTKDGVIDDHVEVKFNLSAAK
jgi:polyisoprenoid-binding protein YceI